MSLTNSLVAGRLGKPSNEWISYEWENPQGEKMVRGEAIILEDFSTSGTLTTGFWRISSTSPGAEPDGSQDIVYPAPTGDDITIVLEGTATLTVVSTGETYEAGPGSILSTPSGLQVRFRISPPVFKTAWCIWSGSRPVADRPIGLKVDHVRDNPAQWLPASAHRSEGRQVLVDEVRQLWTTGSTGHLSSFIGRWEGSHEAKSIRYVTQDADETMVLLQGCLDITEGESGVVHQFHPGDMIGIKKGLAINWASKGPGSILSIRTCDN